MAIQNTCIYPGLSAQNGFIQTLSGTIPADWESRPLSAVSKVLTRTAGTGKYETVSISAGIGFVNQAKKFGKELSGKQYEKYIVLENGDFSYNKGNSNKYPQGCIYRLTDRKEAAVPNVFESFRIIDGDADYFNQLFISGFLNRQLSSRINHGVRDDGLLNLTAKDFYSCEVPFPPVQEQKKIAAILIQCDSVIALQQEKIDEIKKLKKYCLQKMFPQDGADVPGIRFPGFTGAWKQSRFSDIFSFLQNNTLSRAELSIENGAVKNIHYGDVLTKYGEYLDVSKEQILSIPAEALANKYESSFLQDGDIIIADTAEDEAVGKCCEIANLEGSKLISGLHTLPCRPNQKYFSGYLGYYMNSPAYHDQLLPLMQGTKVTSISKTTISNTEITYPVLEAEQSKISHFFLSMDNLITLYQCRTKELKKEKQALAQLLFTGIVRVNM